MIVIVTRTLKQTTQVEIKEAVGNLYFGSMKELREEAIDLAKGNFANHIYKDYSGDGDTYKIRAIV